MSVYNGQKVLVVEDNYISFKLIDAYFARSNLVLINAEDGLQALEIFKSDPDIQLILMDIQLPGLNGLEVTKAIRKFNSEIPIIAATANAFDDDKHACLQAGCNKFITKPINFNELFELMDLFLK